MTFCKARRKNFKSSTEIINVLGDKCLNFAICTYIHIEIYCTHWWSFIWFHISVKICFKWNILEKSVYIHGILLSDVITLMTYYIIILWEKSVVYKDSCRKSRNDSVSISRKSLKLTSLIRNVVIKTNTTN